jgi:hypothetical protein
MEKQMGEKGDIYVSLSDTKVANGAFRCKMYHWAERA